MSNDSLITYLNQIAEFFDPPMGALERFILNFGTDYKPAKRPKGMKKMRDRQCFKNAYLTVEREPGLTYVEGYAYRVVPMLHAWCVTEDGTVVDPTWRDPQDCFYRGVPINKEEHREQILKHEVYGVLDPGMINLEFIREWIIKHGKDTGALSDYLPRSHSARNLQTADPGTT